MYFFFFWYEARVFTGCLRIALRRWNWVCISFFFWYEARVFAGCLRIALRMWNWVCNSFLNWIGARPLYIHSVLTSSTRTCPAYMPEHAPGIINNHITDWLIVIHPVNQRVVSFKIPIELTRHPSTGCHCPYMSAHAYISTGACSLGDSKLGQGCWLFNFFFSSNTYKQMYIVVT